MPAVLQALSVWLYAKMAGLVGRVLVSLGMGTVAYLGVTEIGNELVTLVNGRFQTAADMLQIASMAGLDISISLIISAHMGLIAWIAATTGFKRLSFISGGEGN